MKERCFEQIQKMSDSQIESIIKGKVLAPLDYDSDNEPAAIPHETQSTERQDTKTKHTKQQVLYFCYLFICCKLPFHL